MKPPVFNHQQYTDLEADYMILKAENEKLKAQLSTTNKRLEAAVEDLKSAYIIGEANDGKLIYDAGLCSLCRKNSNELCDCPTSIGERFEWRGTQEAGKEKAE